MLGDETALAFELQSQRLLLSGMELVGRPNGSSSAARPTEPPDHLPARLCELADGPWRKANSFDLDSLPDRLSFQTDGSARFEYREASCSHELRWGVRDDRLLAGERANACDLGQPGPQNRPYDWPIEIDDGVLYLTAEYRRERDARAVELVTLRTSTVVLSLELESRLRTAAPVRYRARLDRRGDGAVMVQSVRADLSPVAMRVGGFDVTGASQLLFEQRLNATLQAGETVDFEGQLTTEATGAVVVRLELRYSRDGRALQAERALIGLLER